MQEKPKKKKNPAPKKYTIQPAQEKQVSEPMAVYATNFSGYGSEVIKYLGGLSVFPNNFTAVKGKYDFITLIRKGISRLSLDYLMGATGLTSNEMADILHTSERTLRRYTEDTLLNPEQSERAIELASLYSRGENVFGGAIHFREWMERRVLALGNKKPKEFLDTSMGIGLLMDELGRIEHGIFA